MMILKSDSGLWSSVIAGLSLMPLFLAAGCSSVKNPYIPGTVGEVARAAPTQSVLIDFRPKQDRTRVGEPIVFTLSLRNTGDEAIWIPREPSYRVHIIYSNGKRDNSLEDGLDDRFFGERDSVLLHPGEQISSRVEMKTYYFEKGGITEFYAVVSSPRNTNPRLSPFWNGRAVSNSYGVLVEAPRGYAVGRMLFGQASSRPAPTI